MNRVFALVSLASVFALSACNSEPEDPNLIKVGHSSESLVGDDYESVISDLESAGFTNIKTVVLDDLVTGWITSDGETEEVEVAGEISFAADDKFLKDAEVTVTYHTFPQKSEEELAAEAKADKAKAELEAAEKAEREAEEAAAKEAEEKAAAEAERKATPLTVENSKDFAALLKSAKDDHSLHQEFAEANVGQVIEFDGCLADSMRHGNYNTRWDFLIYRGDCDGDHTKGPTLVMIDKSYSDFGLEGEDIPDSLVSGLDFRFTSKVMGVWDADGEFVRIELSPMTATLQ